MNSKDLLKGFLAGVLCTLLGLTLGAFLFAKMGWIPANADSPAPAWEKRFAHTALNAWLERNTPAQENPVKVSDETLLEGMKLYSSNCAGCHGDRNGVSEFGRSFYPPTPQFTSGKVPHDPDAILHTQIARGTRMTGMPAYGKMLQDEEIWKLVSFIKKLNDLPPAVAEVWKKGP